MPFGHSKLPSLRGDEYTPRHSYECLRNLLNRNTLLLEMMAELESELSFNLPHSPFIQNKMARLADETLLLVEDLNALTRDRFESLYGVYDNIRSELTARLWSRILDREPIPLGISLEEAAQVHKDLTGDKAHNLGRVREVLPDNVPAGFVLTTEAYWRFLHEGGLFPDLVPYLQELEAIQDLDLLQNRLERIQERILAARIPGCLEEEIVRQASRTRISHGWAVRSSAVGEDGRFSFAGQFESFLNIPNNELMHGYQRVIQSRFKPRVVIYRRLANLKEIDTPMAVLFLALVEARSAGVLYTRDPGDQERDCMLVQSVWGLAQKFVAGGMEADRFVLPRSNTEEAEEVEIVPKVGKVVEDPQGGTRLAELPYEKAKEASLSRNDLKKLWEIGHCLEQHFRTPLDIEWVLDPAGKPWVVQARPLVLPDLSIELASERAISEEPLLEGGIPIQAGRASGPILRVQEGLLPRKVSEGSILVVPVATPEIATLLPHLSGCISETGNTAGHAASLLREWKVPSLFGVKGALGILEKEEVIGLDALHRRIYRGCPWPEISEKKDDLPSPQASTWESDPLCKHVFPLHLIDPSSPRFRPKGCTSLHDIIRFVHERAVESLFEFGDRQAGRGRRNAKRLKTDIPLNMMVLDLGGGLLPESESRRALEPEEISSVPFQAIWLGISDPEVSWAGRQQVSLKGFTSGLVSSMAGSGESGRALGDRNYLLAARDYMNMNLRLAYHYTMVDSLVGESPENNFVSFRFRGGGARPVRREFRARFLSDVLLRYKFAVDRRGDLVTAWLKRYPRGRCEEALAMLGRLMACSRQLDMLISSANSAREYANRFLAGDYELFR